MSKLRIWSEEEVLAAASYRDFVVNKTNFRMVRLMCLCEKLVKQGKLKCIYDDGKFLHFRTNEQKPV